MTLLVVLAFLGASIAGSPAQQQKPPVFRSGVDLITVEVLVLDKNGRPITDLTAADFTVSAGGRARRIVAADYVAVASAPAPTAPAPLDRLVPAPTSNAGHTRRPLGRSFLFLVDTDEIRAGEGRGAMKAIASFIDGLHPDDLVGVVSMPTGTPRVELTTNRDTVKKALGLITGTSRRPDCDPTPGEAAGILARNDLATQALLERTISMIQCRTEPPPDRRAARAMDRYRLHARAMLDAASAFADAMAPMMGLKTLVLVSEGLVFDSDLAGDVAKFGGALERARVLFYALHLDAPVMEASAKTSTSRTGLLDDRYGFDGMAEAAYAGGGEAIRAIASATPALNRIDTQLGGYYQLAFERDPVDKEQARLALTIRVARPNADVRARRMVTITSAQPASATVDARSAIGRLLRSVTMDSEIRVDIATYAVPGALPSAEARVFIVAEIGDTDQPVAAMGYEIADASGRTVADTFDTPPKLVPLQGRRQSYVVTVPLPPGGYRIRLGVVNEGGGTGSIEHAFVVRSQPTDAIRLGDVILGDDRSGALRPIARVTADMARVVIRVDLEGPASSLTGARGRLRLTRVGAADPPVVESDLELRDVGNPARRMLAAELDLTKLAGGVYEVSVSVIAAAGETTAERRFAKEPRAGPEGPAYEARRALRPVSLLRNLRHH